MSIRKHAKAKKKNVGKPKNVAQRTMVDNADLKSTLFPAIPSGEEIRSILRSPECLKHLIWMTDHKKRKGFNAALVKLLDTCEKVQMLHNRYYHLLSKVLFLFCIP